MHAAGVYIIVTLYSQYTRTLTFENFCQLGATLVMLNRPSLKSEAALALLRAEVDYKIPQLDAPEMASIEERVAQEMAAMRHKISKRTLCL